MKLVLAVPTLSRADLLDRFYPDLCNDLTGGDLLVVLDNGQNQDIRLPNSQRVEIHRIERNIGASGSWNWFLRRAFIDGDYDGCVLLQDDIRWSKERVVSAKNLLLGYPDVDLFLAFHSFSVQVHRPGNIDTIGYYDARFFPALCEDDDYALQMIQKSRIYQRFHELDPLPGNIKAGTRKGVQPGENRIKLKSKWGGQVETFGVNSQQEPYYETNRGFLIKHNPTAAILFG